MSYYEEDDDINIEEKEDDQEAWDWGRDIEKDIDSLLDATSRESFIEQNSYIASKCVHEDDYEGALKAEEDRRFAAFRDYASFLNFMTKEDPIINNYFAGDTSCAW